MLERLINEDRDGAEELFHEIVVEKSRDIYESLLENDLEEEEVEEAEKCDDDEEVDEATDEEVDESDEDLDEATNEDDDEEVEEGFDLDEFEVEADPMDDMGGDPADDMMGDIEADADDEDKGDDEEIEDRVVDLEDALDDLKAEFEKMMSDDDGEEEPEMDMDMDMDDEGDDDDEAEEAFQFEAEDEDEETEESAAPKTDTEQMREYVEKIAGGHGAESKGKAETADNKTSPVAGANDMGGDASNLVQGGEETGGKADSAKEENAGNVNVPGGKAGKSMKAMPKGHGAEKKGAGETAANKKSTLGS